MLKERVMKSRAIRLKKKKDYGYLSAHTFLRGQTQELFPRRNGKTNS